jgi:hypothetical protein
MSPPVKAFLYELDAPWSRFAPGAAPAPSHRQEADLAPGIRFLGYDWKRRNEYLWEISYYWTTLRPVGEDYSVRLEFHRDGQPVRTEDHFLAGGRHPFPEWQTGEVVRQTRLVYLGAGNEAAPMEALVGLVRWGLGPAETQTITLRLRP